MVIMALGLALVLLVSVAIWWDLKHRRIPNWLTASGLLVGITLRSFGGLDMVGDGLQAAGLGLLLSLPLFILGGLGGGDVKLFVAIGAFLEPFQMLQTVAYAAVAGAVLALAWATRQGTILPLLFDTGRLVVNVTTLGRHGARQTLRTPGAAAVPYGLAIGAGALLAWFT